MHKERILQVQDHREKHSLDDLYRQTDHEHFYLI